jgi:TolB-like protein/DNA-binding winged helix-turn-helix (wHTH) protein/Flp pilus assembly protein TadD
MAPQLIYRFGPFTLDPAAFRLLRGSQPVPLSPKALDTLVLLVRERHRGLTKQDILDAVWADTAVTENTLTQRISEIREALGESPSQPLHIRTIPRVGYQFVGTVVEEAAATGSVEPPRSALPDAARAPAAEPAGSRAAPPVPASPRSKTGSSVVPFGPWLLIAAGAVLALVLYRSGVFTSGEQTPPARPAMLVVLPFENLSGDPGQAYFSDGLTEEMIGELARMNPGELGVIARTSSMTYAGSGKSVETIAAELGVDFVLEGSVRREGDRVRIAAQLIRAADQSQVWANSYDRELRSILGVQRDVARAIAAAARVRLTDGRAPADPERQVAPEAYQAYLRGRFFLGQRTGDAIEKAREQFQLAIAIDPGDARAHAGLADAYELAATYAGVPPGDAIARATAAAERARELDAGLSDPYTSLGIICVSHAFDWPRCEGAFAEALARNENDALAHKGYSELLSFLGRHAEAIEQARRAVQLDPLSLVMQSNLGVTYYRARRFDEALEQIGQTLRMDPHYMLGHFNKGLALAGSGKYDEAAAAFRRARQYAPDYPDAAALLAYAYGRVGRIDGARAATRELDALARTRYVSPYVRAAVHVGLGEHARALSALEQAYADRSWLVAMLNVDPVFDALRGDARFEALLRQLGFRAAARPDGRLSGERRSTTHPVQNRDKREEARRPRR